MYQFPVVRCAITICYIKQVASEPESAEMGEKKNEWRELLKCYLVAIHCIA